MFRAVLTTLAVALLATSPLAAGPPLGHSPTSATALELPETAGPPAADPDTPPPPEIACPPNKPVRFFDGKTCIDEETAGKIKPDSPWSLHVNPDGTYWLSGPPTYNPGSGQWGNWNPAREPCNPNIQVKLKQAALAGSQLTRAVSDQQLGYPQVDPIMAVNNPKKDGYGGVCTVNIFIFDEIWRRLGTAYEQIKDLIDALKDVSMDDLFSAGCAIVNDIFGDVQHQLLDEVPGGLPLNPLQQLANQIKLGFVAPLDAFISAGLTGRPTTAEIPGVTTSNPLVVYYVPGKGYVYVAQTDSGMGLVLHISPTPLIPEDAAPPGSTSPPPGTGTPPSGGGGYPTPAPPGGGTAGPGGYHLPPGCKLSDLKKPGWNKCKPAPNYGPW